MTITKRKGARTIKEIPKDIFKQLNHGELESANLVEWLAVDRRVLLENVLRQHDKITYLKPILERLDNLKKQTVNTLNEAIGTGLLEQADSNNDRDFLLKISTHRSDLVRSWLTYSVGKDTNLDIGQMLQKIRSFAADSHFNVREEAWTAVRPAIAQNLDKSIAILSEWALDEDENLRRFASEATRPRGVWCQHIEILKENPELALPILEPLKSDPSKYVRDSVGNWLNDASKSQPEFVEQICRRWEEESDSKETKYIIKKALRTLNKPKSPAKK